MAPLAVQAARRERSSPRGGDPSRDRFVTLYRRWYLAAIVWNTFFGSQRVSSSIRTTP